MLNWIVSLSLSLAVVAAHAVNLNSPRGSSSQPGNSPEIVFQESVREVQLGFHLLKEGRVIKGLQKDQFTLYQDGQRVTEITGFYEDQDLPLRLLLMMDTSASMSKGFSSEKTAAVSFLRRVVRTNIDRSAVMTFSTHAVFEGAAPATSPASLHGIALLQPSGLTAMFDSICEAAAQMADSSPRAGGTRNALVLLSDGADNYSRHSLDEAIAAAQSSDLVIYAITAHPGKNTRWGDANLEKLTAATGGRVFFVEKFEQSEAGFVELEREMRSQYTVTFRLAESACGFHSVRVEPVDRKFRARSRSGFYRACP